jgi:hypothetical protein
MKFTRARGGKTMRHRIRNTYISGELKMEEVVNQTEGSTLR